MKIWQKLALLVAIAFIPMAVMTVMLWNTGDSTRASVTRELAGLQYATALRAPLEHIPYRLAVSTAIIGGDHSLEPAQAALAPLIDGDLAALETVDRQLGAQLGMTGELAGLERDWQDLKAKGTALSSAENLQRHTALIAEVQDLVRDVSEKSDLRNQPKTSAFHLASALLAGIPQLAEDVGQTAASGVMVLGRKNPARVQLAVQTAVVDRGLDSLRRSFQAAALGDPQAGKALAPALNAALSSVEIWLQLSSDEAAARTSAPQYCQAQRAALANLARLGDAVNGQLQPALEARMAGAGPQNWQLLAIALAALLVVLAAAWWIYGGMHRQLLSLTGLFAQIGPDNFAARAQVTGGGELGAIASSLNELLSGAANQTLQSSEEREQLEASIRKLRDEISSAAQGDLTVEADITAEATGAIADSFNLLLAELRKLIGNVQATTLAVHSSAAEVESTNLHLASGGQSQATRIMEATAAIDDMLVSIADVSKNAGTAGEVAEQALKDARSGADTVQKTISGMDGIRQQVQQTAKRIKRLGEGSQEIGEIVGLIGDIADRTSILALNASIQAAMAGEAGKGFAVVAQEVEHLADRSAKASKKIASLIKSIQSDTNDAVAAMEETTREVVAGSALANEAGQKLVEIESVSNRLAELIQSILMAARQQSRGRDTVARSMTDISRVAQDTATGTRRAVTAIRRLSELAEKLRGSLGGFKLPHTAP